MKRITTIGLVVWKFVGFQMVVLLVGVQSIPGDLYEAARVDGASTWQRLRYITIPALKPTIALLTVLSVTGSLLAFDQFYVLTHGGPDNSTVTVVLALYNKAFQSYRLGDAAAEAVVEAHRGHLEQVRAKVSELESLVSLDPAAPPR